MSQQLTQNVDSTLQVILTLDDVAVTGLAFGDLTCAFSRNGAAFEAKTLDGTNFAEVGNGVYAITFLAAELDTVGLFTVVVTGADIDQSTTIASVSATAPAGTSVSLETCVITGHVFDGNGQPIENASVSARALGLPSIEQHVAAVTQDLVTATTDSGGQFFLELVRLADVEITIPRANYRRQLVVPNAASASLFDIP